VRTAAEVGVAAARAAGTVPAATLTVLDEEVAAGPTTGHGVDALVVRAFDYLQHVTLVRGRRVAS
jgi:hypothetical protein